MSRIAYPSLEHVAMAARAYPTEILEGRRTGLVLFAAAFLGHNDAIHFADAGLETTCVDVDGERLEEMRALYRDESWRWIERDAWDFAREAAEDGELYDVVSADTFTGAAMERSLSDLETWTTIARYAVTVTATRQATFRLPKHWRMRAVERSPNAYWLVLERP